ncbi:MAG: DNA repair protein RecN [Bacilli bacterium]
MLQELHISNLAVIEDTTLSIDSPYIALVGETGAVKSLIVVSLCLLRGDKADYSLVRDSSKKAMVSALFSLSKDFIILHPEVSEYLDSENSLLLKRTINTDRTSRYYLNDEPVTLANYRNAVSHLIDIHSQGENWELLDEKNHLFYLDRFAAKKLASLKAKYSLAYQNLLNQKKKLSDLIEGNKELDSEYLKFQISEIEKYHLKENEIENLNAEYDSLKDFARLNNKYQDFQEAGSYADGDISTLLGHLLPKINPFMDTSLAAEAKTLHDSLNQFLDSLADFDSAFKKIDNDPRRIDQINERLFELKGLQRKYGKTTAEIRAKLADYQNKMDSLKNFNSLKEDLENEIAKANDDCLKLAKEISLIRHQAKNELEKEIGVQMSQVGLPKDGFQVFLKDEPLSSTGTDSCVFLTALNAGLDYTSLKKAASGGESSRLMLSLKVVLNALNPYDLLIFDEIDSGISGRIASLVAKKISAVSSSSQVLVISHLAQVVSSCQKAYRVIKNTKDGKTFTTAKGLNEEEFVQEVAKILSGEHVTEAALNQARQLISENRENI